jgi:hypothetical protein
MAITAPNSILVLGAGVSAPFGIPLGGQLIDHIAKRLEGERGILGIDGNASEIDLESRLSSAVRHPVAFYNTPIYAAALAPYFQDKRDYEAVNRTLTELGDLWRLLRDQTSETIDDFIVENRQLSRVTKSAIAAVLFVHCYALDKASHRARVKDFSARHTAARERNWIHLLINIARNGIRLGSLSPASQIKIVTFNYDTVLEYVFGKQFSNSGSGYGDWRTYFDVIHVHGRVGELKDEVADPSSVCAEWAKGIHVVNESEADISKEVVTLRKQARQVVDRAERIYAAGFAFAPTNCKLIGLDNLGRANGLGPALHLCNYDGNVGVKLNAEKLKRVGVGIFETPGTIERPLSVTDWLRAGHLGDLPG